jgi:hypothetical protein
VFKTCPVPRFALPQSDDTDELVGDEEDGSFAEIQSDHFQVDL